jgi:hypothetical protein
MRSSEWFSTRQERAEQRLRAALHTRDLTLGTLLDAFREIIDEPVSDEAIRIMAQALGVLPVDALLYLVSEAARSMRTRAEDAASRTEARVAEGVAKRRLVSDRRSVTVASIREVSQCPTYGLLPVAAALQALAWAVDPPSDDRPIVVY